MEYSITKTNRNLLIASAVGAIVPYLSVLFFLFGTYEYSNYYSKTLFEFFCFFFLISSIFIFIFLKDYFEYYGQNGLKILSLIISILFFIIFILASLMFYVFTNFDNLLPIFSFIHLSTVILIFVISIIILINRKQQIFKMLNGIAISFVASLSLISMIFIFQVIAITTQLSFFESCEDVEILVLCSHSIIALLIALPYFFIIKFALSLKIKDNENNFAISTK